MNNIWKWLGAIVLPFVAYFIVSFIEPILHFIIRLRSDYDAPGFLGWGARAMEWFHVNIVVYLVCAGAAAVFSALPAFIAPRFKKVISIIYGFCFILFIGFGTYASISLNIEMGFDKWATIIFSIIGALIGCAIGCMADEK